MNHPKRSIRVSYLVLITISVFSALPVCAGQAKKSYSKALVGRKHLRAAQEGGGPPGEPAAALLVGLDGRVLEVYDDVALVEINARDKDEFKNRGNQQSVLLDVHDDFDKVFLNGKTVDVREANGELPGERPDPPYAGDESGTWLVQFVGPIKAEWLTALNTAGIVPVQYVPSHTYIVGARESAIRAIESLPYVQWTSQMHRYFKPSVALDSARTSIVAMNVETAELWIELAKTIETPDTIARLQSLSVGTFETDDWSDTEVRVQGVFEVTDIDTILAEPLVFGLAERPTLDLSDERSVLGLTKIVPSVGGSSADAGKYKKWLSDVCASCTNLHGDGFYIGIADTGLDGGDRAANGTISGEPPSTDLHRAELAKSRVAWGRSFASTAFTGTPNWSTCGTECPDTTGSKHDTHGHGTMVTGIAAGDPPTTGGKDGDGFFHGLGVAPSAGIFITKVSPVRLTNQTLPVRDVTTDARGTWAIRSYWQNYSLNQYATTGTSSSIDCATFYDGGYTLLSRDFDQAVRDGDRVTAGDQQITISVSSGNINQQMVARTRCVGKQPILTLPPATAKNVIAIGGGENVRPDQWLCRGTLADDYSNLAMNAKHGTAFAGWYKPDLIAVSSNIASTMATDAPTTNAFCAGSSGEPALGPEYRAGSGTSFAAPVGAAAATLASRRFSSNPASATPALVKAMLVAGAKSMRNGIDRAWLRRWNVSTTWLIGDQAIPTAPNGHYYEVESVGTAGRGDAISPEPAWPTNGGTINDGFGTTSIVWRDKGPESQGLPISHFPNGQQGFGRIALDDVLSDYPMRVFVNETQTLSVGGSWSHEYVVHDLSLPVRIALVWTDQPAMWTTGATSPTPPLVNDLDLSVRVNQSGNCVGRYVGNDINSVDESIYSQPCIGGVRDSKNNIEVARFFASSSRGDTTFTVKVDFPSGTSTQNFALVVWNAYDFATVTPPPPTPTLTASGLSGSQVALSWSASAGATSYDIQRSVGLRDPYVTLATVSSPATSYTDSGRTANTTYLYRIRARNATGVSDWSIDPATTIAFTDPALVAGQTTVKAVHISQLREAVASIRVLAELPTTTWADDPLVIGSSLIRTVHIAELRTALNEARATLALPAVAFTDGALSSGVSVVRAVHIQQLRDGL